MKKLLFILLFSLFSSAHAMEILGIRFDNYIQIESHRLVINGVGVRFKYFNKEYAAALYLPVRTPSVEVAMADIGARRMLFHMMSEQSAKKMLDAMTESVLANHSATEMQALQARYNEFSSIILSLNQLKKGDVLTLDYVPGSGTRISLGGVLKGTIEGADFNRALLRIWIGERPVQEDLKFSLLGRD